MGRFSFVPVVAVLVLVGRGALAKCPDIAPGDLRPCATCIGDNGVKGADTCAWCYATQKCVQIKGFGNPCPQNSDFSLFGDDCDCRPGPGHPVDTCASCTRQLGCVWISEGQRNWTISVGDLTLPTFATNISNACIPGTPIGPDLDGGSYEGDLGSMKVFSVRMVPDLKRWCWGQCTVPGLWLLMLIVLGGTLALFALVPLVRCTCSKVWRCLCCCCPKRRPRLATVTCPYTYVIALDGNSGVAEYTPLPRDLPTSERTFIIAHGTTA
mmetsp:Transcript_25726/g.55872  ORF Transcript_25726/g.55872 Transcript_25726/m.55872 type:complete len:268 (+) Transcript_25726:63-866(+)